MILWSERCKYLLCCSLPTIPLGCTGGFSLPDHSCHPMSGGESSNQSIYRTHRHRFHRWACSREWSRILYRQIWRCTSNLRMGWTLLPHCPSKNLLSNQGHQWLRREAEPRRASWAHQPWGRCTLCLASFVSLSYIYQPVFFGIHLMYPRTSWQDRSLGEQSQPSRITRLSKGCFCLLSNIHHWFCRNLKDIGQIS
jgi:hypothetical protein